MNWFVSWLKKLVGFPPEYILVGKQVYLKVPKQLGGLTYGRGFPVIVKKRFFDGTFVGEIPFISETGNGHHFQSWTLLLRYEDVEDIQIFEQERELLHDTKIL